MPLSFDEKKAVVAEVADVASSAHSAVAADYRGLTVYEMTDLRQKARSQNVYLKVVKNTLARRAVEGTEFECMSEGLTGPLMLAFSTEDPGSAARVIKEYAKITSKIEVRAVAIGGQVYGPAELDRVATLPTRDEALAQLAGTLRAPLDKFARTLNEVPGKLVRTVEAVRAQKAGE
ncbi:50S ribosomal protein L10 [Halofilum ochraceum]|uniref:50S ribosomal protein L10 n=1 Tax=Halofilum ochraceum TaxID=1611323 RepID=UPI00082BB5E5|nr:50S ribosomal protein L10 [Halofilum ochraceum]